MPDYWQTDIGVDHRVALDMHVYRLRKEGLTFRAISERLGDKQAETARQRYQRHCRRLRHPMWVAHPEWSI